MACLSKVIEHLSSLFGVSSDPRALEALARAASVIQAPAGAQLFASGDQCESFVVVADGRARIQLSTKTGRDITLFRLERGQSCALTTSCLLSEIPYYAEGVAETDIELISIPSVAFRDALDASPEMMKVLLSDYASRIGHLTGLVDRLTSRDLNSEIAAFLKSRVGPDKIVPCSHKEIADELGTAREVVSRRLKEWEKLGWVKLLRGRLLIRDEEAIARFI